MRGETVLEVQQLVISEMMTYDYLEVTMKAAAFIQWGKNITRDWNSVKI